MGNGLQCFFYLFCTSMVEIFSLAIDFQTNNFHQYDLAWWFSSHENTFDMIVFSSVECGVGIGGGGSSSRKVLV